MCIERARCTAHEAHGDEYRHKDNGGGHQCRRQTAHGINSSIIGGGISLFKTSLHSLYHNDTVIHNSTNDKYKGKEGKKVKAESYDIQEGKGAYERHDDGQGGYEGGANVVEEEIYHQHYQQDSHNQSLHYIGNGGVEEVLGTRHVGQYHSLGQ